MKFTSPHPQYEYLRKKWIHKHHKAAEKFLDTHSQTVKSLTLGGLGGLMMLSTPAGGLVPLPNQTQIQNEDGLKLQNDSQIRLVNNLSNNLPADVRPLNPQEESAIAQDLSLTYGVKALPEIDGIRLNRSYGLIGGEQHLYRFPGDSVFKHADTTTDWAMYGSSGIAPGLGAWGYFAPSEVQMTHKDKERERWYIAVQTFLAPGFAENVGKYRDFFKYRKMLLVNPQTGQAVVTDIADAGPAEWTGKHLGGSPEVMEAVGLAKGPRKGAVLYFFIDDPNDTIPLGPISPKETARLVKI